MNAWIAQHFFNPAYVLPWGAALVALPVIIHLINRMRYRRIRFAAMEFLLASEQRNRRRLLLEQLLLLLLRVTVVVGLVALIARLILDPTELSMFRGTKAHHVVLLDDSGSMRNRWGETTAFEEAVETVKKLVAEGARRPDTQKFSLLLLSEPDQIQVSQQDVNDKLVRDLETRLENLRCSHRALNLVTGLDAARKLLAPERATIKHLHVISDFREADWQSHRALGDALRALDEAGVAVNLVKTVPQRHANLAVAGLTGDVHVAAIGVPFTLRAAVKNFSDQPAGDVRLAVVADNTRLPMSIRFEKIEAGAAVEREFDVTFSSPGQHSVEVSLDDDPLPQDNTRYLAITMAESNPVLIIDGDPAADDASYVRDALAAEPGLTGFAPMTETIEYLRRQPLERFQSIYLLNVPELPPDALGPLRDYVKSGGGLAWFVGNTVNPAFYTETLYAGGGGLFPVPLAGAPRELPRGDETNPGPDLNFAQHPMFRIFEGQDNPFVESVHVDSYLPVAATWNRDDGARKDGVATIAALRNKEPLMFEHRFGEGRVVACLTTAGPLWNDWVRNPSYVVFLLELQKRIARQSPLQERTVGETIAISLDPAVYSDRLEVTSPDAAGAKVTPLQASLKVGESSDALPDSSKSARLTETFRETGTPGVYSLKLLRKDQVPEERWITYNVPLEESDLALATNEQILAQVGGVGVQIQETGTSVWLEGKDAGEDVRNALLVLLVVVLLAEQLLAYKLSYHPRPARAAT